MTKHDAEMNDRLFYNSEVVLAVPKYFFF